MPRPAVNRDDRSELRPTKEENRLIAAAAGLDESGLGEYLFPVDLVFVIYRSGMTMALAIFRRSGELVGALHQ